ncbi:MAG: hypothetical protein LBC44_04645 [Mycoplasmataceae bacterium]|jgi:hypothetical protein|nr:hypothetical protein [Mycoplasmataceae bacterium]
MPDFDWYLTPEEFAESIRKSWLENAKKLRAMLEKSIEMRWKCKDKNYTEFWEISYNDLTKEEQESIERYETNRKSFNFIEI